MAPNDLTHAEIVGSEITINLVRRPDGTVERARIDYALVNRLAQPVAVFDAGSTRDPKLPSRRFRMNRKGDLAVVDGLQPIPDPAPPAPMIAIGRRLEPGARHQATTELRIAASYPIRNAEDRSVGRPQRIQYCLGVATFDPDRFRPLDEANQLWVPAPQIVDEQLLLCSNWIELNA